MINLEDNNEDLLRDLVKKADLESPSMDFTQNVMMDIKGLSTSASSTSNIAGIGSLWIWVSLAFLAAFAYLVYYFMGNSPTWLVEKYNPVILPVVERIFESFKGFFQTFKVSSFTLVIFGAVVILFIADGVLRKLQIRKNIYFSF